jgi:hypothetical protein
VGQRFKREELGPRLPGGGRLAGAAEGGALALTQRAASAAYRAGWLVVRRVPESWARWVFRQVADILWRQQGKGVQQLEANLRGVVPGDTGTQLRQLSSPSARHITRWPELAGVLPGQWRSVTSGSLASER